MKATAFISVPELGQGIPTHLNVSDTAFQSTPERCCPTSTSMKHLAISVVAERKVQPRRLGLQGLDPLDLPKVFLSRSCARRELAFLLSN